MVEVSSSTTYLGGSQSKTLEDSQEAKVLVTSTFFLSFIFIETLLYLLRLIISFFVCVSVLEVARVILIRLSATDDFALYPPHPSGIGNPLL